MRIKKEMIARAFGSEAVLVPIGDAMKEHNGMFMLSETALFIWNILPECESEAEITEKLCGEYDVTPEEASADVNELLTRLKDYGIIE